MSYLVDTNILLRMCQPNHAMYPDALKATTTLLSQGETLCTAPQNIVEFWNVATRPVDKNGLGMSLLEVENEVTKFETLFPVKLDLPAIHQQWLDLVNSYQVKGVNVHDARLVAVAMVHGLTHILTFNDKDFRRYQEITVVRPDRIQTI